MSRSETARRVGGNMAQAIENPEKPDELAKAETEAKAEGYIQTPYELGQFRRGWAMGIVERYITRLERLPRYMPVGNIRHLADNLETLYNQTKRELWGDET